MNNIKQEHIILVLYQEKKHHLPFEHTNLESS